MLFVSLLLICASLAAANTTAISCSILSKLYPDSTFFPGTTRYTFENTFSWSATAWLGPACVFAPYEAVMVSQAVQLFVLNQTPFSIRSGGAMPVSDAANIGPEGILISSTNMTTISLSKDKKILSVGSGITWPTVYDFLEPYNVIVNGIRIGNAGVVGFLLGGGIGFFSYEHGIAATGVFSFECVLADGSIVIASETEHSDLFWALRGGGNSFAIVTGVKLKTINSSIVQLGNVGFGTGDIVKTQYIQSIVDFALYAGTDPKSAMEGQVRWNPSVSNDITYWAFLFYNGNTTNPPGLVNVTAPVLPFTYGSITEQTMGSWADSFKVGFSEDTGFRELFYFFSLPADPTAFRISMDTYFSVMESIATLEGFFTAFSIMPITSKVVAASAANGGNPLGLNSSSVPALWLVESPTWALAADDAAVVAAHAEANVQINSNLAAAGFEELPFVYLSDAQKGESVFPAYGEANLKRLKSIRDFYDPEMVYTKLMPGGDKVALA